MVLCPTEAQRTAVINLENILKSMIPIVKIHQKPKMFEMKTDEKKCPQNKPKLIRR